MNLGQRIVSAAVRDLGRAASQQGSIAQAQDLLSALPWSGDLSIDFVRELLDTVVQHAAVLPPAAVVASAELILALVRDRDAGLQRAAVSGALRVAAAAGDPERMVAYARLGLSNRLVGGGPSRYVAECYEALGRGHAVLGDRTQAEESFHSAAREAAAAGANEVEARALGELAADRLTIDDPLAAVEFAEAAVRSATADDHAAALARAYGLLGIARLRLGELAAAEQALRQALALAERAGDRKGRSDWLGNLGIVALKAGHFDEAVHYHQQALRLSQKIGDHDSELVDRENLAATLARAGRADEAVEQLITAVRTAEGHADPETVTRIRRRLLHAYTEAGQYAEALALSDLLDPPPEEEVTPQQGAVTTDDADPDTEEFLAKLRGIRRDDLTSAQALVDAFAKRHPHSYAAAMGRGMLLRVQGRPAEAVTAYEHALELAPNRIDLHNNLLAAAGAAGTLDTQAERYRALVRDDPVNPVLRFALGCAYLMRGQLDPALRELRESLRLGEPSGVALSRLCAALVAKGKAVIAEGPPRDLERWSTAWGYFEECRTIARQVHGSQAFPEAEALVMVSDLLVEIAFCSNDANPPLLEPIGDREFDMLTEAGALLLRADPDDPWTATANTRFDRLAALVQSFGEEALFAFLEGVTGLANER